MFSPPTTEALFPFQVGIRAGTMPASSLKGAQGPSKNMAYSPLMPVPGIGGAVYVADGEHAVLMKLQAWC